MYNHYSNLFTSFKWYLGMRRIEMLRCNIQIGLHSTKFGRPANRPISIYPVLKFSPKQKASTRGSGE